MSQDPVKTRGVSRFRTFEEARAQQNLEAYQRGFDGQSVARFLDQVAGLKKHKNRPALYRFKSFEEAFEHSLKEIVASAVD